MRRYLVLSIVILIFGFTLLFAQDKTKRSGDIFRGKWFGSIKYDAEIFDNKGKINSHYTSSLKNIIIIAEEFDDEDATPVEVLKSIGMDDHTAEWMSKMRNSFGGNAEYTAISRFYDCNGKLHTTWKLINGTENIEISGHFCSNNRIWISSDSEVEIWLGTYSDELSPFSLGGASFSLLFLEGMNFEINDNRLFINFEEKLQGAEYGKIKVTGELSRIYVKKDTLGKTIQINEPIITDEYTQKEIVIPAVPEFPYKIGEVVVAGNTECIFLSESELHLITGEIYEFVDKNWWEKIDLNNILHTNGKYPEAEIDIVMGELTTRVENLKEKGHSFKVRTPNSVLAVRGTEFITHVNENNETILTVLDGVVEFSDTNKTKTVLVGKNQTSTVKCGELPSEPIPIDPENVFKWWK